MKAYKHVFVLSLVALLVACATSLNGNIATGYKTAIDYVNRTERLYDAGLISKAEARERAGNAKKAQQALDTALLASNAGQVGEAQKYYVIADTLLLELEKYLLAKEKK